MKSRHREGRGPTAALLAALVLMAGCTATPQPDIPQDVSPVDAERIRIDLAGPDELLVTGLSGSADRSGTGVRVEALSAGELVEVPIGPDGSFVVTIRSAPDQVLGVAQTRGQESSALVFVAGNARREAVLIGSSAECRPVAQPTEEVCLECATEDGSQVVGCSLPDFTDEAALNPANVGDCLFLSTDTLVLEPTAIPEDVRFGAVSVFNDCGEAVLVGFAELESRTPERFQLAPPPPEAIRVEPTFFGDLQVVYDGSLRAPEDPPDDASTLVQVSLPPLSPDDPEAPLGTMVLSIVAP